MKSFYETINKSCGKIYLSLFGAKNKLKMNWYGFPVMKTKKENKMLEDMFKSHASLYKDNEDHSLIE